MNHGAIIPPFITSLLRHIPLSIFKNTEKPVRSSGAENLKGEDIFFIKVNNLIIYTTFLGLDTYCFTT